MKDKWVLTAGVIERDGLELALKTIENDVRSRGYSIWEISDPIIDEYGNYEYEVELAQDVDTTEWEEPRRVEVNDTYKYVYEIDWDKVETVQDLLVIVKALKVKVSVTEADRHKYLDKLLKLIDDEMAKEI